MHVTCPRPPKRKGSYLIPQTSLAKRYSYLLKTPAAGHRRTPKHPQLAGAAGRLRSGCTDQNKPIIAVTVAVNLACEATVQARITAECLAARGVHSELLNKSMLPTLQQNNKTSLKKKLVFSTRSMILGVWGPPGGLWEPSWKQVPTKTPTRNFSQSRFWIYV